MLPWRGTAGRWGSSGLFGALCPALPALPRVSDGCLWWLSLPRRYPERQEKLKVLYIRIVSPFPEMEQFIQATVRRYGGR